MIGGAGFTFGRTDPETGRMRIIFVGEIKTTSFPFPGWIEAEPKFTLQKVPCDLEWFAESDARRFIRLYLPRTYEQLTGSYDVILFEDFTLELLPAGALERFQRSIGEEGLGVLLVEFAFWSQNLNAIDLWMESTFFDVFPAEVIMGQIRNIGRVYYEIVREDPIFRIPDVSKWGMNWASHGDLKAREGAVVHAIWKGRRNEAVVSRDYGKGKALQIGHGWDNIPATTYIHYRYLPDLIFNQIFFVADVPPPEDLVAVHNIRADLIALKERRKAALSLLDFVDKFGANTGPLEEGMANLDRMIGEAETEYIMSSYAGAREVLASIYEAYAAFEESAVNLKERALLWIYVIEWTVVTATLMVCLQALWALMVRKRLYRDVGTTRGEMGRG
jgi:hypothetical protein